MSTTVDNATTHELASAADPFFARLGLAFAAAVLISGLMMFVVGPVPQDEPVAAGSQIAGLDLIRQ